MSEIYETPALLDEYLLFHYGSSSEILPDDQTWPVGMKDALGFAARTPTHFSNINPGRGLDIGSAVGRSAFEMTRECTEVVGMDFSNAFIDAAERLRTGETLIYQRKDEAHLKTPLQAKLPSGIHSGKVRFFQGDAMNLPGDIGSFDRVHAANLLCRLTDPELLLSRLPELVNPCGQLVLATPCTWLEDFTPSKKWPVGSTLEWLISHLGNSFSLIEEMDEPFLIRETARKFQWTRSMVTVWSKR